VWLVLIPNPYFRASLVSHPFFACTLSGMDKNQWASRTAHIIVLILIVIEPRLIHQCIASREDLIYHPHLGTSINVV
jgi:hypothetical protein